MRCVRSVSGTWHIVREGHEEVGDHQILTACVVSPRIVRVWQRAEVDSYQELPRKRGGGFPRICTDCPWDAGMVS